MFLGETQNNARQNAAKMGIGGLLSALLYLMAFARVPGGILLMQLAPIPLLYVGFQSGFKPLVIASSLALFGVAIIGSLPLLVNFVTGIYGMTLVAGFILFQHKGKKKFSKNLGNVLLGILCFSLLITILGQWGTESQLSDQKFFSDFLMQMEAQGVIAPLGEAQKELLFKIAQYMPGLISAFWLFVFIGLVFLTQTLSGRQSKKAPLVTMKALRLPESCFYLLVIAVLGSFLSQKNIQLVSMNAVLVLSVPFLLKGFSVIHSLLAAKPQQKGLLIAMYILSFTLAWPLLFFALLGLYSFIKDQKIFRLQTDLKN